MSLLKVSKNNLLKVRQIQTCKISLVINKTQVLLIRNQKKNLILMI